MNTIKVIGSPLYQWEIGRQVQIFPMGRLKVSYVHFSHLGDTEALVVVPTEKDGRIVADIPNILLQSDQNLVVYVVDTAENCVETLRECVLPVRKRAKPTDYVYTETEVLNYAYLDERLKDLEGEGLANAVAEYLKENPVQAGATAAEAAQIEQNKQNIATLERTKLAASELPNAVNEALAQAKASGAFDGKDGKDYVLTEADKQEIAQEAAGMVEVPEGGTVTDEQIASAVEDYMAENPVVPIATVEPAEDDIPKVFLTGNEFGNMNTTKNEVSMGMEYFSKTERFHAAIKIKFQGNSSLFFSKKNFTIKMYTDNTYQDKLEKSFKDWNTPSNKYVLKANFIDHSHARNIVSARLWDEIVASRPDYNTLPEELRNSPRNGAIDGFPVKLYVNGTYQGLYTWNIGKDDWMWGMDKDNANHALLCGETHGGSSAFLNTWNGVDGTDWSVEVGTNSTALQNSLNNLIQFVMNNDGEDFKNGIGNYLDIQSVIDYYIFQYEICSYDCMARNMLLATFDGTHWICGAYDMDSTFGLTITGGGYLPTNYACPEDFKAKDSLLWKRLEANYVDELKARQAELRKSVLSYSNIVTHFERFMDAIGLDLYAEDLTIYTDIPSGSTNNIKQLRDYIRDRQAYVDAEFAAMTEFVAVPCTGITLSASELTFTEEGTQTLTATVTPNGCTDSITWESSATGVATVFNGVVTAVADGDAVITARCGAYSAECAVSVAMGGNEGGGENENVITLTETTTTLTTTPNLKLDNNTGETSEGGCYITEYYIAVTENASYTVAGTSGQYLRVYGYDNTFVYRGGNHRIVSGDNVAKTATFTVPSGVKYIRIQMFGNPGTLTITIN